MMEPSPTTSTDRHQFLLPDDDDGDTASQRSISLSSPPASARSSIQPSAFDYSRRVSRPYTLDTDFSSEAPDDISLNSPKLGSRDSPDTSAPSSPKAQAQASESTLPTYPPQRTSDSQSIAESFASGSSKKARPESMLITPPTGPLVLGIALVDFNHLVGPRIEYSRKPIFDDEEIAKILPFLALPDGAHLSAEDYSYFHLVASGPKPTTIFGISCNQQISASALLVKDADVTRSTVQKAVVVLASKPLFGPIRDKLGVVTTALFQQRDFTSTRILDDFEEALEPSLRTQLTESGLYMGTNLRDLVHTFRQRTLILVKALMLQKRILFYGHPVERLCTSQYSLISLLPGLLQTLDDSGSPPLAARAPTLSRATTLKTSDRKSMMAYMGLPLDIFGKDAFFQPYLPLQQLDLLKDCSSWLCGSTNSIVTQQKEIDILVNMETGVFEFRDPGIERSVALTPADRKWMDDLVRDVNEGWDEENPDRVAGMAFKGSDDYLRSKFEEYISAALSSVRYHDFVAKGEGSGVIISGGSTSEESSFEDFNAVWLTEFKRTSAFEVWERVTDPMLFDIVEPRHPCVDKPSVVSDIGLRLAEGIQELKLEQQLGPARERVKETFKTGQASFFKAMDGVRERWAAASTPVKEDTPTPPEATNGAPAVATPIRTSMQSLFARRFSSTSSGSGGDQQPQSQSPAVTQQPQEKRTSQQDQASPATPVSRGAWASSVGSFWNRTRSSASVPVAEEEPTSVAPSSPGTSGSLNGGGSTRSDLSVLSSPSVEVIEPPLFTASTASTTTAMNKTPTVESPTSIKSPVAISSAEKSPSVAPNSASSAPAPKKPSAGLRSLSLRPDVHPGAPPQRQDSSSSTGSGAGNSPIKSPVLRSFTLSPAPVSTPPLDVSRPRSPRIPTGRSSPVPLRKNSASPVPSLGSSKDGFNVGSGRPPPSPSKVSALASRFEKPASPAPISPLSIKAKSPRTPTMPTSLSIRQSEDIHSDKVVVESPTSDDGETMLDDLQLSPPISPISRVEAVAALANTKGLDVGKAPTAAPPLESPTSQLEEEDAYAGMAM